MNLHNATTYAEIVDYAMDRADLDKNDPRVENFLILSSAASRLDYLRREVRDSAHQMAQRFTQYVAEMDSTSGLVCREPPTGWSNLPDMTKNAAQHDALVSAFKDSFKALAGVSFVQAKRDFDARNDDVTEGRRA